ncbi:MAG: glycosyltransferase family 4 protein [Anaerolineae bacterium]|nr:glycosyltransferase family 4 protein [Anaerolineae bacterium]
MKNLNLVFIGPFGLQPKATMSVRAVPLAKALAARGHTVTALIPPWDDPDRAGQTWTEEGIQVVNVALPRGILRLPLFFHIFLTRALIVGALKLRPDVIHFFKPKAYAGLAHLVLWWLRRLSGAKWRLVVDTDDWEQDWNEWLPYSTLQKKIFTWQERWGLSHADAITVASRTLAELAATRIGRKPADIFYLPNGHHTHSTRVEPGRKNSRTGGSDIGIKKQNDLSPPINTSPTILLFTRFFEFRLERIVTLVGLVASQLPQARWLIVGAGWQGEEKILETKLAQANLAEYAHFTGWLPLEQLPAYFQAADVAVYPYDDTLINRTKCSVKLISLLAAGLPVVADAVGQNCEYIEHGVSGLLVPAGDDDAFSQAVLVLLQQPETRQKVGQAAAKTIQEKFNWANLAQIAEKAYD